MADHPTELNSGSGGDKVDTEQLTVSGQTVIRQRVQGAGAAESEIVAVTDSDPVGTEYGWVTRNIPSGTQAVSAASLPLPTGAATQATLAAIETAIGDLTTPADTQPISAGSLPLPTGAATSAKQPALGTAGTASADVLTVQGIASMTALKVDGSAVTQPVSLSGDVTVAGKAASGAAVSGNPVLVGGSDGTSARTIATDSTGLVYAGTLTQAVQLGRKTGVVGRVLASISTASTNEVAMNSTTYTEPASGAQRSIDSSQAQDTAAGTGARKIRITYYAISGTTITGPFTEDIVPNAGTPVNTVATNIWGVVSMEVIEAGSTGLTAGTITLYNSTGATGGTLATIGNGLRRNFYSVHYVPSGKTFYLLGWNHNGTVSGSNIIQFRWYDYSSSNPCERILVNRSIADGGHGDKQVIPAVPPAVAGPARIVVYVSPAGAGTCINVCEYEYMEI